MTSNPFDDTYDGGGPIVDTSLRVNTSSNNPFDDAAGPSAPTPASTNPFLDMDDDDDDNNTPAEEDTTTLEDENFVPAGAPIEASWQYLGDLPYRRIPMYSNVRWGDDTSGEVLNYGLSAFPKAALQRHPEMLNPRELRELLNTSTITKVVGCPYGGPIAAVTLPIMGETSWFSQTEIRIMTNAGKPLSKIYFPGRELGRNYSPSDIMEVGFTDRTVLVVILRDSLCLTYDLSGEPKLPPFHLLPRGEAQGMELFQATIFEGGAAAVSTSKHSAIVEFLDEHDDPTYFATAHMGARQILPARAAEASGAFGGGTGDSMPSFCGLITGLPTAAFAR
jgi:hypothetical protein